MTIPPIPEWVENAIFYQIFVDRFANGDPGNDPPGAARWGEIPDRTNFFGGDLQGILDRLPYLSNLGVTALYLTPIFKAQTNHKYDTCDYLLIDPAFGDAALLKQLVAAAHARGIRIVLDAVFNHCGEGFWAFEDVRKNGAASKYAGWFFAGGYPLSQEPPNYQTCGGVGYLPKLNTDNPEVQEYLIHAAIHWIETCDIDGWRLDTPWKASMDFWRAFRRRVKQVKPEAYIVGEVWRVPQPWLQGDTCDGLMNYPLRNHVLDYCLYDSMDAEDFNYEINLLRQIHAASAGAQLNLLDSHDTPRLLTLCKDDAARAALAAAFLFTYVGAPMVYYGDETGLRGGNDPDCRRCMPWDETGWDARIHQTYKKLIHARRAHPALRQGDFIPLWTFNGVYAYLRRCAGDEVDEVIVILNPREERREVAIPLDDVGIIEGTWHDLLGGGAFTVANARLLMDTLPSKCAYVLVSNDQGFEVEA